MRIISGIHRVLHRSRTRGALHATLSWIEQLGSNEHVPHRHEILSLGCSVGSSATECKPELVEREWDHAFRIAMLQCRGFGPLDPETHGLEFLEVFAGHAFYCLGFKGLVKTVGYMFEG